MASYPNKLTADLNKPGESLVFDRGFKSYGKSITCRQIVVRQGGMDLAGSDLDVDELIVLQGWVDDEMDGDPAGEWNGKKGVVPDRYDTFRLQAASGRIGSLVCPQVVYDLCKGGAEEMVIESGFVSHTVHPQPGKTASAGAVHRDGFQWSQGKNVKIRRFVADEPHERVTQLFYLNNDPSKTRGLPIENVVIEDSHLRINGSTAVLIQGTAKGCGARRCDLYAQRPIVFGPNTMDPVDEDNVKHPGHGRTK